MKRLWDRIVFAFVCLIVFSIFGFAVTTISGIISYDTTWTLAGIPYVVTGNVLTQSAMTLTFEPGVIAKFMASGQDIIYDWPKFHSNERNSGYTDLAILPPIGLKWKQSIGTSSAHPVIVGKTIYVGSESCFLYALDAETGNILWKYDLREPGHERRSIRSAALVYNDIVITNSWDNVVYALDANSGSLKWKYVSPFPLITFNWGFFITPSPTVHNGIIYIGLADGRLHAINIQTGTALWTFATTAEIVSTPAYYENTIYFGAGHGGINHDRHFYAVNAISGSLVWAKDVPHDVVSSPAINNGVVYFGTSNIVYALDYRTGNEIWRYALPQGNYIESSPALSESAVYICGGLWSSEPVPGDLFAININNGALIWKKTGYFTRSSPSISKNILYIGEYSNPDYDRSSIYAIDTNTGNTLWSYKTNYIVSSIPAIADNKVFVAGGDGYLYSFGKFTLVINISSGGTTYPSPGTHIYDPDDKVILNAFPDTNYRFVNWTGDYSGENNPILIDMDKDKTIKANFLRIIYPPLLLGGQKVLNRSFSQAEYINVLTWNSNPNNENIVGYRIYLIEGNNQRIIGEVNSATFRIQERNVDRNKVYTYSVLAVNNENREGDPAYVTIR
jgi:outer membrane protein assembly factor BamB